MQDAEPSEPPPNRRIFALGPVALSQGLATFGITLVYPFRSIYKHTFPDAPYFNAEALAGPGFSSG